MKVGFDGVLVRAARKLAPIATVFVAISLSACGEIEDAYMVDSVVTQKGDTSISHRNKQWVPSAFDLNTGTLADGKTTYADIVSGTDAATRKAQRDELAWMLIRRSNEICEVHKGSITADSNMIDFGFSQTSTILSGLGGILSGADTTRILSGSAAAVNAMQGKTHDAFYQDKLASAITQSIDGQRAKSLSVIEAGLAKGYADYSADQMLVDLVSYHQQCSFYAGVDALAAAAENSQPTVDNTQAQIQALQSSKSALTAAGSSTTSIDQALQILAIQQRNATAH